MEKTTIFSQCRKYRYTLWREWDGLWTTQKQYAMFICLNSSTANETKNDNTVRRCIRYACNWGYTGLCIGNLFAFCAREPKDMKAALDPVGPDNNKYLIKMAKHASVIIAAWGIDGAYLNRDKEVIKLIPDLHYLKLTKNGFPAHPLFLPKTLKPILWQDR